MIFEVDLNKLIASTITIQNYLFLQIVYHQNYNALKDYKSITDFYSKDDILFLMSIGLLKFIKEDVGFYLYNLETTEEFESKFIKNNEKLNYKQPVERVEDKKKETGNWMEDWYALFPRGIKNGIYPIKGDKKGCFSKLTRFRRDYPEFTIAEIMEATKDYINQSRLKNYAFMQQAHFFVMKNNISTLASYCEMLQDKRKGLSDEGKVDNIDDI